MKRVDSALFAELIGSVIGQCRKDIMDYLNGKNKKMEAYDAIKFIFSEKLDFYLDMIGLPRQDFDLYRKKIVEGSVR